MIGQDLLEAQIATFAEYGYVKCRLVPDGDPARIDRLCTELLSSRSSPVHVGDFGEIWQQHHIPYSGEIASLLTSGNVRNWAQTVSRGSLRADPYIWGNVYRTGQHITWHRDRRGQVQLVICLRQPSADCGGIFQVKRDERITEIELVPGDGILFRATQIEHRMTPLKSAMGTPDPVRITAVARYFPSTRTLNGI